MPTNKEVFDVVSHATLEGLKAKFGPPEEKGAGENSITAKVAVALLQLSLKYFADTGAPSAVVFDFFLDLMGIEKNKATVEKKGGGLVLVPPSPHIVGQVMNTGNRKARRSRRG